MSHDNHTAEPPLLPPRAEQGGFDPRSSAWAFQPIGNPLPPRYIGTSSAKAYEEIHLRQQQLRHEQ